MTRPRIGIAKPYEAYRGSIAELPERFLDRGDTLHTGRNLIKTLTLTGSGLEPIEVVVKAFAIPALPRGLVYAHVRRSKAASSMLNAQRLVRLQINTPEPIACIEYLDSGYLGRSYYVCRHWHHDYDLTPLLYGRTPPHPDTDALLRQLARFTVAQHNRGVLHLDYNPGNILVRTTGTQFAFALVDLNRLCFTQLGMSARISGLVRLTTVVDYTGIIGRHYAQLYGADPEDFCRRLERAQRRFQVGRYRRKRSLSLLRRWKAKLEGA